MKIMVSGTPGTGKTEVSAILAEKLKYQLIKINDFAYDNDLIIGNDPKRGSLLIDTLALESLVQKIKDDCVIEGHLAHFLTAHVVFVLRTNPDTLTARLEKRNWLPDKINENVEAEILDVCLQEAVEKNKQVYEIDTTDKTPTETMELIQKILKKDKSAIKNAKPGNISWESYLNALAR